MTKTTKAIKKEIIIKEKDLPLDVIIAPMDKMVKPQKIRIQLNGRVLSFGPIHEEGGLKHA
jgi:hypothetical protein